MIPDPFETDFLLSERRHYPIVAKTPTNPEGPADLS
jgi:hypothetical protein